MLFPPSFHIFVDHIVNNSQFEMKKVLFKILSISILFCTITSAQNTKEKIREILSQLPESSEYSVMIYNPLEDEIIYEHNIEKPMIPASNTKLFTTVAALEYLGPDAKVYTRLLTDALEWEGSTLDGNIYIKGFGDPTFSYSRLDSMVKTLADSGLKVINGGVFADDSYFDDIYTRDDWIIDEKANVNLPPVSALVIDRNELNVRASTSGKAGNSLEIDIRNKFDFCKIINSAKITSYRKAPRFDLSIDDGKIELVVKGGLRKRKYPLYYSIFVESPRLWAASILKNTLEKHGITVNGKAAEGVVAIPAIEMASSHISLLDLLKVINKNSDNFKAEALFKLVGAYYANKQGNSFYATQAILTLIDEMGIFDAGTEVVDGSGISRFNFVTTRAVVELLSNVYFDENLYEVYKNTLSVSGKDGTLEKRIRTGGMRGKFFGKTGTLRGVTALSGYLETKNGNELVVSIILQYDKKGGRFHKNIEDEIIEVLYKNE